MTRLRYGLIISAVFLIGVGAVWFFMFRSTNPSPQNQVTQNSRPTQNSAQSNSASASALNTALVNSTESFSGVIEELSTDTVMVNKQQFKLAPSLKVVKDKDGQEIDWSLDKLKKGDYIYGSYVSGQKDVGFVKIKVF